MDHLERLRQIRIEYEVAGLDVAEVDEDPFQQFDRWLNEAIAAGVHEPNAFVLATVDTEGRPSTRAILLKGYDTQSFTFFSNYESAKAHDLDANPWLSMCFLWLPLHRQIRIDGAARRVSEAESDSYFASRPRGAQLGAHASPQSREIPDRGWLETKVEELSEQFEEAIPRPKHWGGYRVEPHRFEFWQGQPSRLHDRIEYERRPSGWSRVRLAP